MSHRRSPFYIELEHHIAKTGGMHNAHLHLDRAGTTDEHYLTVDNSHVLASSHVSLHEKHSLINNLHASPAYSEVDFHRRVNLYLDHMVEVNTRRADTLVDVTADAIGLRALAMMQDIKRQRADEIDLNIAAYSPFGFDDSYPEMWEVFAEGAESADFIAALPEADDRREYPGHIGFDEHLRRTLELARHKQCMIHVHTDQRNEPSETGTEQLIEALARYGGPQGDDTLVWAVHMISPSTYDDGRFAALTEGMKEFGVGVICCPSAALGMRQLRPINTPTYNSIPRVLELLVAGVPVRLASDNIADICSPSTTADLIDEVFVLSAAIRFYHPEILAKLATGTALNSAEREHIADHLERNNGEIRKVVTA